jgi:hypothetical protein
MMRQIAGAFAQYEKARLVARLRRARELKGKMGGRNQPRSSGFLIARLHVPWATAALDPWQRDLPSVDPPTFKDVPRSVRSQFDDCPISMQFKQSAAVDGPQQTGAAPVLAGPRFITTAQVGDDWRLQEDVDRFTAFPGTTRALIVADCPISPLRVAGMRKAVGSACSGRSPAARAASRRPSSAFRIAFLSVAR